MRLQGNYFFDSVTCACVFQRRLFHSVTLAHSHLKKSTGLLLKITATSRKVITLFLVFRASVPQSSLPPSENFLSPSELFQLLIT